MKKILLLVLTALLSTTIYANNCSTFYDQDNYAKAFSACKAEAEQGDMESQFLLAYMYQYGEGVEENNQKALYWYTKAAKQGDGKSRNNLGLMYSEGNGVKVDKEKAVYWWTQAAEQGIDASQY